MENSQTGIIVIWGKTSDQDDGCCDSCEKLVSVTGWFIVREHVRVSLALNTYLVVIPHCPFVFLFFFSFLLVWQYLAMQIIMIVFTIVLCCLFTFM